MSVRFKRHPDLRLTALEGEGVALHLGSRRYFTVNGTALDILEALSGPCTETELVEVLTRKYDVTDEEASRSVSAFLGRCRDAQLLVEERG